ncbi:hypothetical protein VM1G_05278 [Cytospora mali]|uniref:Apple domain-containing protein n=1 Tax=Cytospora mali TaxID=578113 RepID=A0A194W0K5_CYTMA|nr:hypothetical protein VM1G_05278 [Valsa mali]
MQSKHLIVAPLLASACLAQTSTTTTTTTAASSIPTCGFTGWDTGTNIGFYANSSVATYAGCSALCDANTACLSFSYNSAAPDCILYSYVVEGNDVADASAPNTFFDRGGVCPTTTTTTTSTSTTATTTATPTCSGFVGWDKGTNIGYYADAASATYSGCLARCNANSACLSFGLTSVPACVLYNYTVEGNDVAYASSGNTFYDRGGVCPTTSSTSTSTSTSTSSSATPTQTGAFANCPSGIVPYNVTNVETPYSPCNSSYPYSACMSDIDGTDYCNLCLACTTTTCTSDTDCGTGYACIRDSDCPVGGETNGTALLHLRLDWKGIEKNVPYISAST